MIEWVIGIIVGLMLGAVIIGFIEYLIDEPVFILKLLVRDFKIALFTELNDDTTSNKQLYVIVGVTWFNKIISYQAILNPFNESYSKCFTAKKKDGYLMDVAVLMNILKLKIS